MYDRETQKYIYGMINQFAVENLMSNEEAKAILKYDFLLEKYGEDKINEMAKQGVVEVEEEFFIISGTFTLTLGLVSQKIADEFAEYIKMTLN